MKKQIEVTDKTALRLAVRAYDDYQRMRLAMGNRVKIKKDGSDQVIPEAQQAGWAMTSRDREVFGGIYSNAMQQERVIEKHIRKQLDSFPIWSEYLKGIKGVGPIAGARIISEYDIHEADTVSKLWQYTGLNPGLVRGKATMTPAQAEKSGLKALSTYTTKKGEEKAIVLTEELIRGDKLTPGYVAPFNKQLRTAMVGVLADGFIKAQGYYALEFYYPYKSRLEQEKGWEDSTKGHRDRAAKRYMIKMFLKDLYVAWRTIEGLPVRPPYQEEYLNHQHAA
jgi:hypothetical protein